MKNEFEIQCKHALDDACSKVAPGLHFVSKNVSKGLDFFNSVLNAASETQVKVKNLHHKDHAELEFHLDYVTKENCKFQENQNLQEY